MLNLIYTKEKGSEILAGKPENTTFMTIVSVAGMINEFGDSKSNTLGDYYELEDKKGYSVIVCKEENDDKILYAAMRCAIVSLRQKSLEKGLDTVIIASSNFKNKKEEDTFIYTFKEIFLAVDIKLVIIMDTAPLYSSLLGKPKKSKKK